MELLRSTSRRGFSVRGILVFVLAVIVTALLWATLGYSQSTYAADPAANWKGDSILYDGHQYYGPVVAKPGESHGLNDGTSYYLYIETVSTQPLIQKAQMLYFAPGLDPPVEKTVAFASYAYSTSKVFSNVKDKKSVQITPRGQSDELATSCSVEGIGWFICPVTVFMAEGMDTIFNFVSGFIAVQPTVLGNPNSDLYIAWNIMRSFANVAFIIVFLIIIYSQLTSAGITNYGLKKLLPRLIIAAILVNLSFLITALAVDVSNILGYSLQDIFIQIRQSTFNIDNDTWSADTTSWANVTGFVLSGGTIAAGSIGALVATGASIGAAIYLLLPLLLGLILTILFVLLVLAARQAIIIILIVIAPLAFVAYLLPNTEKWFEKWRDLFMTMLIFFPAFSLVFGGSQLAGGIIIQNATSIFTMIFGLAVQVAPLIVTPLLLKLSGGLLGRIAGLINDPRKGLMDKTKSWSNDRAEMHRRRGIGAPTKNPFRKAAQFFDNNNRRVKDRTEAYTAEGDNRYHETNGYHKIYNKNQGLETEKKRIEATHERDYKQLVRKTPGMLQREVEMRTVTDEASEASERINRIQEGLRSGVDISDTKNLGSYAIRSERATRNLALSAISIQTSKRTQQNQLSEALLKNTDTIDAQQIREWAGITDKDNGAESALTYAVNLKREAEGKLVSERTQLMKHFKLDSAGRQTLAMGGDVTAQDSSLNTYVFRASDEFTMDAAIEMQMKTGSFDDRLAIIANSGTGAFDFRSTISDAIPANGLPAQALFFGGRFINEVGLGNIKGIDDVKYWTAQSIAGGKIKAEDLANNDVGALGMYLDAAENGMQYIQPSDAAAFTANVRALKATAALILDSSTDLDRNATQAAKDVLKKISNL